MADGRDGGAFLGCSAVTDTGGMAVSGRAGSISSGIRKECPTARVEPVPQGRAERPVVKAAPEAEAKPVAAPRTTPAIPISRGQISTPDDSQAEGAALRGTLIRAGATVLTGGVLIWFLHSSLWASLLVLGVPLWRHVDLLPIVAQAGDGPLQQGAAERAEDFAVARVLDASGRSGGAGA